MSQEQIQVFDGFYRILVPYIALSPFQHNAVTNGHEFNPSREKKVNQGVFFDDEVMCVCMSLCVSVCVHMCTHFHNSDLYIFSFGLFPLFLLEMEDLVKMNFDHSFTRNQSVCYYCCSNH